MPRGDMARLIRWWDNNVDEGPGDGAVDRIAEELSESGADVVTPADMELTRLEFARLDPYMRRVLVEHTLNDNLDMTLTRLYWFGVSGGPDLNGLGGPGLTLLRNALCPIGIHVYEDPFWRYTHMTGFILSRFELSDADVSRVGSTNPEPGLRIHRKSACRNCGWPVSMEEDNGLWWHTAGHDWCEKPEPKP